MTSKTFALIPARAGSREVPRKNIQVVGRSTLVERAVVSARDSGQVDRIFVSTDDAGVRGLSLGAGVTVISRSSEASSDSATAEMVVDEFLASPEGPGLNDDDFLVYLQPTSPFRSARHVGEALALLADGRSQSVVSVREMTQLPRYAMEIQEDGLLAPTDFWHRGTGNRQTSTKLHCPNGAIYAFSIGAYRETGGFPFIGSLAYVMNAVSSIDIDAHEDLEIARGLSGFMSL